MPFDTDAYRYPYEHVVLAATGLLVMAVIVVTSTATACGSALFVGAMLALAYFASTGKHKDLLSRAHAVTAESSPKLHAIVARSAARLRPGPVQTFVLPLPVLNAYTFGLSNPKVVVVYAGLLQVMDREEVTFIVGHELGHVRLGHTWLNSLVGGVAGIPSPFGASLLLRLALLWWNRMCEYSADRAGLLACGNLDKAISALVKIETGGAFSQAHQARALQAAGGEDLLVENIGEFLSTHPAVRRRVRQLQAYAGTEAYKRLQTQMSVNAP